MIPETQAAATAGLRAFRDLAAASKNVRAFGVDSANQLDAATLGAPAATFLVRLD